MGIFRGTGVLAFVLFCCSLLSIPGVSAFDRQTLEIDRAEFRDVPVTLPSINVADYPFVSIDEPQPEVTAEAIVVMDVDSKVPIWQKNQEIRLPGASTTKLMTALVALEVYELDDVITMPDAEVYPSVMGLQAGDQILVRDALSGLLISSGNDAALALATNVEDGYDGFVRRMNEKARLLGLSHTTYQNPSGLSELEHQTTARDLAHLLVYAMQNEFIAQTVVQQRRVVFGLSGHRYVLRTTNKLLGTIAGLRGGKTGFTQDAGEVLISYVERNGRRTVYVVLKSEDRFGDTKELIDWTYRTVQWLPIP